MENGAGAESGRVRNAGAYVRVSTDSEKQLHSFGAQKEYWEEKIAGDPKLRFVGVWADEGISGRSLLKRKGFLDMAECAKAGAVDIIFVKSVSRFGRDFIDILRTVRELRDEYGVVVYFEEENLYSDDPTADMELSMRAMIAEQELKDMSENQKWAIRKRFREGRLNNNGRVYGYRLEADGSGIKRLVPVPEEAETVGLIYERYLDGAGFTAIAKELTRDGVPTASGGKAWTEGAVGRILRNEKYTGDALLQKGYTENYTQVKNTGDNPAAPLILVEDDHAAIVTKEAFRRVQALLESKSNKKLSGRRPESRAFTSLIECGGCGTKYRHKVYQYRGRGLYGLWVCAKYLRGGKAECGGHSIKESVLQELFVSAFNEFVDTKAESDSLRETEERLRELKMYGAELYGMMARGHINQMSYAVENERLRRETAELNAEITKKSQDNIYKMFKKKTKEYDGSAVTRFLEKAVVRDWTIAFVFKNGVTVTRAYTNGTSGNKPGWNKKRGKEDVNL